LGKTARAKLQRDTLARFLANEDSDAPTGAVAGSGGNEEQQKEAEAGGGEEQHKEAEASETAAEASETAAAAETAAHGAQSISVALQSFASPAAGQSSSLDPVPSSSSDHTQTTRPSRELALPLPEEAALVAACRAASDLTRMLQLGWKLRSVACEEVSWVGNLKFSLTQAVTNDSRLACYHMLSSTLLTRTKPTHPLLVVTPVVTAIKTLPDVHTRSAGTQENMAGDQTLPARPPRTPSPHSTTHTQQHTHTPAAHTHNYTTLLTNHHGHPSILRLGGGGCPRRPTRVPPPKWWRLL